MRIAGREVRVWRKPEQAEKSTEPVDPDAGLQVRWTNGANLRTRCITYGLLSALAAGPVALGLAVGQVATGAPTAASAPVSAADTGGEQVAVGEFAQQFVLAWLQTPRGRESSLVGFVDIASLQLPNKPVVATQPSTAQLTPAGPGIWSVTVGATVTDAAGPSRRYFQVPVQYVGGAMVATSLPAPMPAPGTAAAPELAYQYTASISDPSATAAGQFLSALLLAGGDVTRYVSPGTAIAAVSSAPYTAVRVLEVRTDQDLRDSPMVVPRGGDLHVLVTAQATVSAEQQVTVQYPLTLRVRAGRWEVASVDPVPLTSTHPRPALGVTTAVPSSSAVPAPSSTVVPAVPVR